MLNFYEIGRYYGKHKPRIGAKQALRMEYRLSWNRDQMLAFLGGFGRGRQERS